MEVKPYDPLLLCLSYITAHYGRAKSPISLISGLPYTEKGMTHSLFIQASERIDINAKQKKTRSLKNIKIQEFPAVLVLKRDCACVLLKIEKNNNIAEVWDPADNKRKTAKLSELEKLYTQSYFSIKPTALFIDPSLKSSDPNSSRWFYNAIIKNLPTYWRVFFASILINIFALVSPVYIMNIYDRVIPNNALETGWALSIGAIIVFIADLVIRCLRGYFIDYSGRNIDFTLAKKLFDQILDMKLAYKPASAGAYANMLKEFDTVRDFITSASLIVIIDLPFSILFLAAIFYLGGTIGVSVVLLMTASLIIAAILQFPLKQNVQRTLKTAESKHGILVETIYGLETIKTLFNDGRLRARYAANVYENSSAALKSRYYSAMSVNIATFIQQIAAVFIVLVGMYLVKDGLLTMGGLIACVMLSGRALGPITQIANLLSRYHQTKASLATLTKIMTSPCERPEGKDFLHRPDLKGNIHFNQVSFQYPNSNQHALDKINFKIQNGEKVGIIGKVGSGKSTIAKLLLKLYEPNDGSILIDGTDYLQIDPADLRRKIAFMSQEATLFRGTIRDNITASSPQATDEEVLRSTKISGAHEFISKLPLGYDSKIGERGEGLSGGQRQCLSLARALLMDFSVFVCDEPTNAMDLQTENNFVQLIQSEIKDQTLILITHRLSLLPLVNRLIVMDDGKIVMDDAREKVLQALSRKA